MTLFGSDVQGLGREALRGLGRSLRGEAGGEHWMERLMGDEQKRLFRETQAVMSLLEGFSDYVMDEVGQRAGPGRRAHQRRASTSGATKRTPFERSMLRLTGMDLKIEQYQKGEALRARHRRGRGPAALTRLWDGPETLPRDGEIEEPDALDHAASSTARRPSATASPVTEPTRRSGSRAGRRADGHRAQPHPVGALSLARPGAHPGRRARALGS